MAHWFFYLFIFLGISERQQRRGISLQLLHCGECQAMTACFILSFHNKRAIISVNATFQTCFGVFLISLQDRQHSQWSATINLNFNSRKYKTKSFEFLRISHWQSLQTCAPAVSWLAPSHQQTPATVTSKSHLGQTAAHTRQSKKGSAVGSLPGWLKGAPLSSSWRWCPDPTGRKSGCGVCWRCAAWPGSASWCCSLCGQTPEWTEIT